MSPVSACMFRPSAPPGRTLSVCHTEGRQVHQGVEQAGETKKTAMLSFLVIVFLIKFTFLGDFQR